MQMRMVNKMSICDLCQLSSPSGCTKLSNEVCLKDALTLIKATATNGDMIKALFPNTKIQEGERYAIWDVGTDNVSFWNNWWNAPYKRGDTE